MSHLSTTHRMFGDPRMDDGQESVADTDIVAPSTDPNYGGPKKPVVDVESPNSPDEYYEQGE